MADGDIAPQLNDNSMLDVRPVTLDADGNIATLGLPTPVTLQSFAAWLGDGNLTVANATPTTAGVVKQGAAVVNLTDNSAGTSGGNTIAAVTDNASAANAIATLAAKVNAILIALRNAGIIVT